MFLQKFALFLKKVGSRFVSNFIDRNIIIIIIIIIIVAVFYQVIADLYGF